MGKTIFISLAFAAMIILTGFVSANIGGGAEEGRCMMSQMMDGVYGFGFMWMFGWVFMALVIVALVLLVIWLFKQIQKTGHKGGRK